MNEEDIQPQQIPSWQEVQQSQDYQNAAPADRLVAFSRWHDAAYNAAQNTPDWAQNKDEFNKQAAQTQAELSQAADGLDPQTARVRVALDSIKQAEASKGAPLTDEEKSATVSGLGEDIAKAYSTPPSIFERLYRPVAAAGEGFAGGLGQTLQSLGYFASQPSEALTKTAKSVFGSDAGVGKVLGAGPKGIEWLGARLQKLSKEPEYDIDPRVRGGISEAVGHTAGGLLEFLGETALGSAELKAVGLIPKVLSKEAGGKLAAMSVFGLHNAAEGINQAQEAGATEDQVLKTALAYGAVGAGTAAITPFQKWLSKFDEASGGNLTTMLKKAATEGGQFAAQMFAQQFGNNAINRAVLMQDKSLLADTFEQAKSGGATGVIASLVLGSLMHGAKALSPSGERVQQVTQTPTGKVAIEADQAALDKINALKTVAPESAAAATEAVTGEKPVEGRVVEPQAQQVSPALAALQAAKTPEEQFSIRRGAMWDWAAKNVPELRQQAFDAAGNENWDARDKLIAQIKEQFRNSPEAAELGIKPSQTEVAKKAFVEGTSTPDEFIDNVVKGVTEPDQANLESPETPERKFAKAGIRDLAAELQAARARQASLDAANAEAERRRAEEAGGAAPTGVPPKGSLESAKALAELQQQAAERAAAKGEYAPPAPRKESLPQPAQETPTIAVKSEIPVLSEEQAMAEREQGIVNPKEFPNIQLDQYPGNFTRRPTPATRAGQTPAQLTTDQLQTVAEARASRTPAWKTKTAAERASIIDDMKASALMDQAAGFSSLGKDVSQTSISAAAERAFVIDEIKKELATRAEKGVKEPPSKDVITALVAKAKDTYTKQYDISAYAIGEEPNRFRDPEAWKQWESARQQINTFKEGIKQRIKDNPQMTDEEKGDLATEAIRRVQEIYGRLITPEGSNIVQNWIEPAASQEAKELRSAQITKQVLATGVMPDKDITDRVIGRKEGKKLREDIQAKLDELYPPEKVPTGATLLDKNVYSKTQKEFQGFVIDDAGNAVLDKETGKPLKKAMKSNQTYKAISIKDPVTGDILPKVQKLVGTGRNDVNGHEIQQVLTRNYFTNDPKITAQQVSYGEPVQVPKDLVDGNKINPAIHLRQGEDGKYYVANVDTLFGNFAEPGSKTKEGRIAYEGEYQDVYKRAVSQFQQAPTPVRPGAEGVFEGVLSKENARISPEDEAAWEEAATEGPFATAPEEKAREQIGMDPHDLVAVLDQAQSEGRLPKAGFEQQLAPGEDAIWAKTDNAASPENVVSNVIKNREQLTKLGLDKDEPVLNALRTIAVDREYNPAQRRLAQDLLGTKNINWNDLTVKIGQLYPEAADNAAYYEPSSKTIGLFTGVSHDGGVAGSLLHELGHHILDAKLKPEYQRTALEEKIYQQLPKMEQYARDALAKAGRDFYYSSPGEMLTGLYSGDPAFAAALREIAPMPGYVSSTRSKFATFFEQIVDAIKRLFTGKDVVRGSLYDQMLDEVMGLTRSGEAKQLPDLAVAAVDQERKNAKAGTAQEDINGALNSMNRQQLEEAARDIGLHNDEINTMTQDELRNALGGKPSGPEFESIGDGYGGWLDKHGNYTPVQDSMRGGFFGHSAAAEQILAERGENPSNAMSKLLKRGYVRIQNFEGEIRVDGNPTDKQIQQLKDAAEERGMSLVHDSEKGVKVLYNPRQAFARAGRPGGQFTGQPAQQGQVYTSIRKIGTDLVGGYDAAGNIGDAAGVQVSDRVAQSFGTDVKQTIFGPRRAAPSASQMQDRTAARFVSEALGNKENLRVSMDQIANSTKIDDATKQKYLGILQHGYDNFDRINGILGQYYKGAMKDQLQRLRDAGIDVAEVEGYVHRILERPEEREGWLTGFLSAITGEKGGGTGRKGLTKSRTFEDTADAIANGYLPKSEGAGDPNDIVELTKRYITDAETLVQHKLFQEEFRNSVMPDGQSPIIASGQEKYWKTTDTNKPTGERIPNDYEMIQTGAAPLIVHKDVASLFRLMYGDSSFPKVVRNAVGFVKLNTLLFDTYHVGRIMAKTIAYSKGAARVGYQKGLSLLQYSDYGLREALQSKEINQKMYDYATEKVLGQYSRRDIARVLLDNGANFGRVADNLMSEHAASFLPIKNFNKWVFQKLSRGAMIQTSVENFIRNRERFPELSVEQVAKKTAKEYNEVFGNLQMQSLIKNKFYQDLVRSIALAPQWAESQARAEIRGVAQIGRAVGEAATGKFRLGTVAQGQLSVVLGMLALNQVLNLAFRGHPTWQNKEEGHKFDAYIPSLSGKGRGFWFSPFEIGAEYTMMAERYLAQHQTPVDVAAQIGYNKLGPLARGITEGVTGRNYQGRPFSSTGDRIRAAVADAMPFPIGLGAVVEKDPRQNFGLRVARAPDSVQKQAMQSVGMKVANYQSPISDTYALAHPFRADKSYSGDKNEYFDLKRALDIGDNDSVEKEIRLLASRGHTERQLKAAAGLGNTGSVSPILFTGNKNAESKFRKMLTPDQRETYNQAQKDHRDQAKTFLQIFKAVRPELSGVLKENDRLRKGSGISSL